MMAAAGRPAGDAPRRPVCTEDEGEGVMRRMWRGLVGDLTDAQSAAVLLAAAGSAGAVWWRTRADGPAAALAMGVVAFDLVGGLVAASAAVVGALVSSGEQWQDLAPLTHAWQAQTTRPRLQLVPSIGRGAGLRVVASF